MDFTKLIALLESKSLYFTRADKFEDPFEGSFPIVNVRARTVFPDSIPEKTRKILIEHQKHTPDLSKYWAKIHLVNCWHENEHESAAMWKLYLKSNEGIAIQSTFSRLKASFIGDETIFLGEVNYINYDTDVITDGNILAPLIYKRKSFEHEREVRAVYSMLPLWGKNRTNGEPSTWPDLVSHGLSINVDLQQLIERIYIAPGAPNWIFDLVRSLINKYECNFEVIRSRLPESPTF